MSVTAAAGYACDSLMNWMYVGNVWKVDSEAMVNSPITIASVRNAPARAATRMFGMITRPSVVRQPAPRL